MEFCDSVISNSLLALSVYRKTVLFHLSLRRAHTSTTCQVGGGPVRSQVDKPGPQYVRMMAGAGGERQDHREAASSEAGDRMAVTCLIPPREERSRRTPDHTVWPEQVSCLSRPSICNTCHPLQASLCLEVSSPKD